MKLELRHLAPYLPYGLKFQNQEDINELQIMSMPRIFDEIHVEDGSNTAYPLWSIKPILRPLSQLTEEIEHNGESFWPTEYLESYNAYEEIQEFVWHIHDFKDKIHEASWDCCPKWLLEKLFEWHFDVFGLIDKGLAIKKQ